MSIDKSPISENKNDNFDLALVQHLFENPEDLVLFEEATLIFTVVGLLQLFKDVIEKKNIQINRNLVINRETGCISLSLMFNNVMLKDSYQYFRPIEVNGNCRQAKSIAWERILAQPNC